MKSVFRASLLLIVLLSVSAFGQDLVPAPVGLRHTGDLDGMVERGVVRVGTTFSRMNFFLDDGRPRGAVWEATARFEETLRARGGEFSGIRVLIVGGQPVDHPGSDGARCVLGADFTRCPGARGFRPCRAAGRATRRSVRA